MPKSESETVEVATGLSLEMHTFATACTALCRGEPILVEGGESFSLETKESRAMLAWYASDGNAASTAPGATGRPTVRANDVNALLAAAENEPLVPALKTPPAIIPRKSLRLRRVKASNFGGLHFPSDDGQLPPDFELELSHPVTLLRGRNGAGKTSVLNSVLYGLTGHLLRSQRAPLMIDPAGIEVSVVERLAGESGDAHATIAPITPVPRRGALTGAITLLDTTSVELEVTGEDQFSQVVRRTLSRRRTRYAEQLEGFDSLGLDAQALEVGTKMPALLAHIRSGEVSDLGSAVAKLTGLSRLQHVAVHADKTAKEKLRKDRVKELDGEQEELRKQWRQRVAAATEAYGRRLDGELPAELDEATAEALDALREDLEKRAKEAASKIEALLGEGVLARSNSAPALKQACEQARGRLAMPSLAQLPAAQSLGAMGKVTDDHIASAQTMLVELKELAEKVREARQSTDDPKRRMLYARLADWLKQFQHQEAPDDCPVCERTLAGVNDPKSNRPVADHLNEAMGGDTAHHQHTETQLAAQAVRRLKGDLAQPLRVVADWPNIDPRALVVSLLTDQAISSVLTGDLKRLVSQVAPMLNQRLSTLAGFDSPAPSRPSGAREQWVGFWAEIHKIEVAIAAVHWQRCNREAYLAILRCLVGKPKSKEGTDLQSLHGILDQVMEALEAVEPYRLALLALDGLSELVKKKAVTATRRQRTLEVAAALDPLVRLGELAQQRVDALVGQLKSRALYWKSRLYKPATNASPKLHDLGVAGDGRLELLASRQGVKVDAGHVANSSDLRATLLALLFAYWERLTEDGRGLGLLLLDDPQELMDPDNRHHLASAICELSSKHDVRLLVTSNDRRFCDALVAAAGGLDSKKLRFAEVHPASDKRPCLSLQPFLNVIDDKRRAFEKETDDDQKAWDYAVHVRIHAEETLRDLLDDVTLEPGSKPTLDPLLNALRKGNKKASGFLAERTIGLLLECDALKQGAAVRELLNRAHHGDAHTITWGEVNGVAREMKQMLELLEAAKITQAAWLLRLPPDVTPNGPPTPAPTEIIRPQAVPRFAERAGLPSQSGGDGVGKAEDFSLQWFEGKAVYRLVKDKLGLVAGVGSYLVVDPSATQSEDNRIVVALHGDSIWARRLLRPRRNPDLAVLASEGTDPRSRDGSMSLPFDEVTTMKVVGVLFGSKYLPPELAEVKSKEAIYQPTYNLSSLAHALKVQGNDVSPVALPQQTLLVGEEVDPGRLDARVGQPVAVRTDSGWSFHRVGGLLAGSTLRLFPGLGATGTPVVAETSNPSAASGGWAGTAKLLEVRLLVGVLFDKR